MLNKFFIEAHVKRALQEDIGFGDITTDYLTNEDDTMRCELNSRVEGILCGRSVFETVFQILSNKVKVTFFFNDGDEIKKGVSESSRYAFIKLLLVRNSFAE